MFDDKRLRVHIDTMPHPFELPGVVFQRIDPNGESGEIKVKSRAWRIIHRIIRMHRCADICWDQDHGPANEAFVRNLLMVRLRHEPGSRPAEPGRLPPIPVIAAGAKSYGHTTRRPAG